MNSVYSILLTINDLLALVQDLEQDKEVQLLIAKLLSDLGVLIGAQADAFSATHPDWSSD